MSRTFAVLLALWPLVGAGCSINPCQQLAERICQCELSAAQRQSCRTNRITNQQNQFGFSLDGDADRCTAALETCTCDALDRQQTDQCGFTKEGGSVNDIEDPPQTPSFLDEEDPQ